MLLLEVFLVITTVLLVPGESCTVPLVNLTASSSSSSEFSPAMAAGTSRDTPGIWCMAHRDTDPNPWIQATFDRQKTITGLKLTGGGQNFSLNELEAFSISYSEDGDSWIFLRESHENKTVKIYDGITTADINTERVKMYVFPYQIRAKYLKLNLLLGSDTSGTCLRFDVVQPSEFCNAVTPVDLLFALENPDTWTDEDFECAKTFVIDILTGLPLGPDIVRVGLLTYKRTARVHFYLDNTMDYSQTISTIQDLDFRPSGSVKVDKALRKVKSRMLKENKGDRSATPNILVVITDGHFHNDHISREAASLESHDTTIYAVCIGKEVNVETLSDIASNPDSRYVMCNSAISLQGYLQIFKKTFVTEVQVVTEEYGSHQYVFNTERRSYGSAELYCRQLGGSLASIHTLEERQFVEQKVESLVNSSGCQQWWIGLQGSSSSVQYWNDGSELDLNHFATSTSVEGGVYLNYSLDWQWNIGSMEERFCFSCKYSADEINLVLMRDSQRVYVQDKLTFIALVNSSSVQSEAVSIHMGDQSLCSIQLNQPLNFSVRNSHILSKFELTEALDGWKYEVFDFYVGDNSTFNITAVVSDKTSLAQVISGSFEHHEISSCLSLLAINGIGKYEHMPENIQIRQELYFALGDHDRCHNLQLSSTNWTVEMKRANSDPGTCLTGSGYDDVDIADICYYSVTHNSLHIPTDSLPNGDYKVCISVLIQSESEDYPWNICGFMRIPARPLVVVVDPSDTYLTHSVNAILVLNASGSYDPNTDVQTPLNFTWTCYQLGEQCDFVRSVWPNFSSDENRLPITDSVLEIPAGVLCADDFYILTVLVDSPTAPLNKHTSVITTDHSLEGSRCSGQSFSQYIDINLNITCESGCSGSTAEAMTLRVNCTDCAEGTVLWYTWELFIQGTGYPPSEDWMPLMTLGDGDKTLTFPAHFLNPFLTYTVDVTGVSAADHLGLTSYQIYLQDQDLYLTKGKPVETLTEISMNIFLVLSDSSTCVFVSVGDDYTCTLQLYTISETYRTMYPLSEFLLSSDVDGLNYGVFDTYTTDFGSTNITVTECGTNPSLTRLTITDAANSSQAVNECIMSMTLNGTSPNLQSAAVYRINASLRFEIEYETDCIIHTAKVYWSLRFYVYEYVKRCPVEDHFREIVVPGYTGMSLIVGPPSLSWPWEGFYWICGTAQIEHVMHSLILGNKTKCGYIHIINPKPLVLLISPNVSSLTHNRSLPLVLNASASYNPNHGARPEISFSWICEMNNQQCDFVPKIWTGVNSETRQLPVTDDVLEIQGYFLTNEESYSITLSIEAEILTGGSHTVVVTAQGSLTLQLNVDCTSGCGNTIESSVSIHVICSNCVGLITYNWTIEEIGVTVLQEAVWNPFANFSINRDLLVLQAAILNPLKAYNISILGTHEYDETGTVSLSASVPAKVKVKPVVEEPLQVDHVLSEGPRDFLFLFSLSTEVDAFFVSSANPLTSIYWWFDFQVLLLLLSLTVYMDTYNTFLILVNSSAPPPNLQVTYDHTCTPVTSLVTPLARSSYPLSEFSLPPSTDNMRYSVLSHQYTVPGMYNVSVSMTGDVMYTIPVNVLNEDDHHCLTSLEVGGTGMTPENAKVYRLDQHIHFISRYTGSCDDMMILSYNWTVRHHNMDDPLKCTFEDDFEIVSVPQSPDTVYGETFHIAQKTLPLGYNRLCLDIVFVSSTSEQHRNRGCGFVKMINTPLVASLSPSVSFLTLPRSRVLILNASSSYNPNSDDQANIGFLWTCRQSGGNCDFVETVWPGLNVQSTLPSTAPVLTIPPGSLTVGEIYYFSVNVSMTGLEGADVDISVFSTNPTTPSMIISCKFGCGIKLNPSELLALEVECSNCNETGLPVQSYTWSIASSVRSETVSSQDLIASTTTGIYQSTIVLSANFLNASDVYSITVTGTNSYSETSSAVYIVTTNSPPVAGTCSVSPQTGKALITHFTITCSDFEDADLPLRYKVYRGREDETTGQLVFYGFASTISHLTFPTGPASTNYTHNITISVFDLYNTSTSIRIPLQVLSPQEGNDSVSKTVYSRVQNFTTDSVYGEDEQDILRFASSVASILNDESTDKQNESVVTRAEAREIILTTLTTVNVDNQDSLEQMSNIIEDLTSESDEVTENIQELAVNVSSQLAESLGAVAQRAPTVAKTIAVKQLSTLEHLIELTVEREVETVSDQDMPTTNDTTAKMVEDKAKPILDLYEKIGDAMLKGMQFSNEEPLKIQAKKTSLALAWVSADTEGDVELSTKLQGGNVEGKFQIPLRNSLQSNSESNTNVQSVNFQVQVMAQNPYVWDESASNVNKPVVNVLIKSRDGLGDRIQLNNLPQPAGIIIKTNLSALNSSANEVNVTNHEVNVTLNNNVITSSQSRLIKISSPGTSTVIRFKPQNNITLTAFAVANNNMTAKELTNNGRDIPIPSQSLQTSDGITQDPYLFVLPELEGNDSFYTIGFTVKTGQFLDTHGDNVSTVDVSVDTHSVSCLYWNEDTDKWGSSGCTVSIFTSMEILHCLCDHLTAFSGGFFVAPNTVDPLKDIVLFLQFFENPVVVTGVLAVWGVYLLLLYWARQKDKEDAKKAGMTVLVDNDPQDKYVYLICVVTGWWPKAGTSANVFLYFRSKYRQSARHMLADPQRKLFISGAENWFVLTTPQRLGKIKSVVVWHDNRGKNPAWYLKEVVVFDIQTKEEWHCLYDDWLAVDRGHGFIQVEIPSIQKSDMLHQRMYQLSLKSSQDFRNSHLWISIFSKPAANHFTRAQRLTCGLSLLLTTMLSSIMFFGVPTDDPEDQLKQGGVVISLSGIVIGIQSGLLMFPINTIIIQLFQRTAPKESQAEADTMLKKSKYSVSKSKAAMGENANNQNEVSASSESKTGGNAGQSKIKCSGLKCCVSKDESTMTYVSKSHRYLVEGCGKGDEIDVGMSRGDVHVDAGNLKSENGEEKRETKKAKKPCRLPWWFNYITWTICLSTCIICSYFVMLYGLKYGYQKSVDWIVSFFTAFAQSAMVTQPIKVMVLAVLLTQILRRPVNYESWEGNQDIEEENIENLTGQHKNVSRNAKVHRYYVPPLTTHMLNQIQKRIKLDNRARFILNEIGLYFTFVAVVLLMIFGHRNIDTTYHVTRSTENMFTVENTGFPKVSTVASMWEYLQDHFVKHLVTDADGVGLTSCQTSYLLGKARLRQLRIKSGVCSHTGVMSVFARVPCTGSYWIGDEDTKIYNASWTKPLANASDLLTAYTYQSAFKLATVPFVGKLATYSGGGFVQELPKLPNNSIAVLTTLMNSDWIDQHTRAVFVEFTLYNPNVNLFSMVILVFEFTNFGGIFPYYQIFTSNLYHYIGGFQIFVAVCEGLFLIYLIAFTFIEVKKFRRMSYQEYLEDVWSYVEVIILALSYTVCGLFIQRIVSVEYSLRLYKESKGQSFISFSPAAMSDIILQYVMASLSMFIIIKFFKLLRFNVRMSLLAGTLKRCKGLLLQFSIKIFIYTIAFASLGYLVFSTGLQDYSSFGGSIITLINFALGASDYFGLEGASSIFGPMFFFLFSVLYHFMLVMIFSSILIDGYKSMAQYIMTLKTEVHMVEFITKKIKLATMTDKKKKNMFKKKMYDINSDN